MYVKEIVKTTGLAEQQKVINNFLVLLSYDLLVTDKVYSLSVVENPEMKTATL